MQHRKKVQKVRLSYLLPYGLISRQALILALCNNAPAYQTYSATESAEERAIKCEKARASAATIIRKLETRGYIETVHRKYGCNNKKNIEFLKITKKGLNELTGTSDDLKPYIKARLKEPGRCKDTTKLNMISEAVLDGSLTIMAAGMDLVSYVNDALPYFNGERLYRLWRIMNICTMFRLHDCLTFLDRRNMNTSWALNGINNEKTLQEYITSQCFDVSAFSHLTLNAWYNSHPSSYMYAYPDLDNEDLMQRPTFYAAHELPGYTGGFNISDEPKYTGQNNLILHTFSGVAVGAKVNYLCYHTRRFATPWFHNVESATAKAVQASLDNYNIDNPIWGAGRTIHNALLFCSTVYQFANLFERRNKFTRPFDSISVIPINNSGAAQLNALLKTSPLEYEHLIIRYLLKSNDRFQEKEHPIFKLTYDGVPVFFGYSMDLNKIMDAYSEYLDKTKFYIVCYAEQVKYYKAIMPEIKFL